MAIPRRRFGVLATTIVPECARLTPEQWDDFYSLIDETVSRRPPAMQRQLGIFVTLLGLLPLIRTGKRLHQLSPADRARALARVEQSRLLLFRRGFWGIRTLVLLGYYGRKESYAEIGYVQPLRGTPA